MQVKQVLEAKFRPEFLHRINETIIFQQFTRKDLAQNAGIQVQYLRDRVPDSDMFLTLTDATKKKLARDGFDPCYGARPLKRLIQQEI